MGGVREAGNNWVVVSCLSLFVSPQHAYPQNARADRPDKVKGLIAPPNDQPFYALEQGGIGIEAS